MVVYLETRCWLISTVKPSRSNNLRRESTAGTVLPCFTPHHLTLNRSNRPWTLRDFSQAVRGATDGASIFAATPNSCSICTGRERQRNNSARLNMWNGLHFHVGHGPQNCFKTSIKSDPLTRLHPHASFFTYGCNFSSFKKKWLETINNPTAKPLSIP